MKIFISTTTFAEYDKTPLALLKRYKISYDLNLKKRTLSEDEILEILSNNSYAGLIAGTEPLTEKVLQNAKALKVISRVGVGIDNIALEAAERLGIKVINTPDVLIEAVSELTIALILSCLRGITLADRNMHDGIWEKRMGFLLKDKTLGIIGFGRIGQRVARIARTFGARIIFSDLTKIKSGVFKQVAIDDLVKNSDIISLHCSSKNRLITAGAIRKMKKGAILVNTSRGAAVDGKALYQALNSGKISSAALDVHEKEPYSGKLTELKNIILTPHIGSYAKEARVNMEIEAVKNLLKKLKLLKK